MIWVGKFLIEEVLYFKNYKFWEKLWRQVKKAPYLYRYSVSDSIDEDFWKN